MNIRIKANGGFEHQLFGSKIIMDKADYIAICLESNNSHVVLKDRYINGRDVKCGFKMARFPIVIPDSIVANYDEMLQRSIRIISNPNDISGEYTTTNLTKEEAYEAMERGKRITHIGFNDDDYLYLKDETIFDADNEPCDEDYIRAITEECLTGWRIYTEKGVE